MNQIRINVNGIAVGAHDEHQAKWIEQTGRLDHDWFTLEILQGFIPYGNIVDIGANIGTHTIYYERIAARSNTHVYAFEANPISFECLAHNCKKAIKYPIALGAGCSLLSLHSDKNLGSAYVSSNLDDSIKDQACENKDDAQQVPCMSLDSFRIEEIGFMKIDVEGFEEQVLLGSKNTIMKSRPTIWIEMAPGHLHRAQSGVEQILSLFDSIRYMPIFCIGTSSQCDVLMAPIEVSEQCLAKAHATNYICLLAREHFSSPAASFAELQKFFSE